MSPGPIRIAVVNDYEIVVAGVAAMLAPYRERVSIVELDSSLPVISDVDVILYDTFAAVQGDGVDLVDLVRGSGARVVIFSWNIDPSSSARHSPGVPPATCPRGWTPSRSSPGSRPSTAGRPSVRRTSRWPSVTLAASGRGASSG